MGPRLGELAVSLVRWVDDYQPGIVACEFVDAVGRRHTIIDKLPVFSVEDLDACSEYPREGVARCSILDVWRDAQGQELFRISTVYPDSLESTDGLAEFVVPWNQVSAPTDRTA